MLHRIRRHPVGNALASSAEERLARRHVDPLPAGAVVPLAETEDVLLVLSRTGQPDFHGETFSAERALACELAARGRSFAVSDDPGALFGKRVAWYHPTDMVRPRLWDYARQVHEFAAGLERQGNRLSTSHAETLLWENKSHMHRRLDEAGVRTPQTVLVTAEDRDAAAVDFEPLLIKEEHSAGSSGIHFFATAAEARRFIAAYAFRPTETLIVQRVVPGATRDLRLTMVGDRAIASATYWRAKSEDALASSEWTTTATTYGSSVIHEDPPETAVTACAAMLRDLGVRSAGIDLMWVDDDVSQPPLVLELSPFFQPNPPKPERYADRSYKQFKQRRYATDGYFRHRYLAQRDIAGALLDQGLF